MKHTQGKWTWYNGCSWWRLGTEEGQGAKETLIICPTIDTDGHPNLICNQWNRNLIASAPELLEACKIMRIAKITDNKLSEQFLAMLDKAISKAEGRE